MPTARAPTPIRRNVAEDVPARCPPSEPWACAGSAASRTARMASPASVCRWSEIDIELQPPLRAGSVVGRIVHLTHAGEVVQAAHVVRIELALAPHPAAAGDGVDAIVDVVVEHVRAREAHVESPLRQLEPAGELDVPRVLHRRV